MNIWGLSFLFIVSPSSCTFFFSLKTEMEKKHKPMFQNIMLIAIYERL